MRGGCARRREGTDERDAGRAVKARVAGIEIGYDDVGRGTPLLLLHPFPLQRAYWAPQLGALVDRARCIAPDFRGFGESTVDGPFTMDRFADDVVALLDALLIDRAIVAGVSMGGYVALALWRRHRERIRALVLANTRAVADTEEGVRKRRALIALAREKGSDAVAADQLPAGLGKTARAKRPDLAQALHDMIANNDVEGIVGATEAMMVRPDSTPLLGTIDVPTLCVAADEDVITPVPVVRAMQERIPGSTLELIGGAGHWASYERPAAFNQLLVEFLAARAGD